jgi:hypothetical protein
MRTAGFSHENRPRRGFHGGTGESGSQTTFPVPPVPPEVPAAAGEVGPGFCASGSLGRTGVEAALTTRRASLRSVVGGGAGGAMGAAAGSGTAFFVASTAGSID